NAVVNFQKSQGLKTDGVVGPKTKAALNAVLTGTVSLPQVPATPPVDSSPPAPPATSTYTSNNSYYNSHAKPVVDSLRTSYDGSLSQALVGRAIWYMEYGYMVYGHSKYPTTGYIDCSNFVSLVYKDFGYSITSAARNYDSVGVKVTGVSVKNGTLVGADKLKPGDILTFQRTNYISHVAMYIGNVNGKPCFIGTTTGYPTAIGIVSGFNNWYGTQFHDVRRVLPASAYVAGGKITDKGPVIPAKYQIKQTKPIIMPKNLPTGF
ncbi:MAG: NlpC/P60 family protein, partial [Syntrophomonas sp.]|nr:NlpC/P60 family protein [Syntrophomonas sp.]